MIQLWLLPEQPGQPADYKLYQPVTGHLTHIYGGENSSDSEFPAKTKIDVAIANNEQSIKVNEPLPTLHVVKVLLATKRLKMETLFVVRHYILPRQKMYRLSLHIAVISYLVVVPAKK